MRDLPEPEDAELRRAFYRWAVRLLAHRNLPVELLYHVEDLTEGLPMIVERMKQWERDWHRQGHSQGHAEGHSQGHAEGLREGVREGRREGVRKGREEGQKQLLVRWADTKFGSAVARRLEVALEGTADASRTEAISDLVLASETGDEFMVAMREVS